MRKRSPQQKAIIRVLKSTKTHPSAEWIYEQVKRELPDIGLATVYRNLRILRESGQVVELHGIKGSARYDGNTDIHHHFFCIGCGKILDLNIPVDLAIEDNVIKETGLKVTRYHIELGGLCLECQ
jgi:Fur family transcriptional regulator, peroxide stress response regulator